MLGNPVTLLNMKSDVPVFDCYKLVTTPWFIRRCTTLACSALLFLAVGMLAQAQTVTLQTGYNLVGCSVNGPGGNNINNASFLQTPALTSDPNGPPGGNNTVMYVWNCYIFFVYYYFTAADATTWEGFTSPAGWYDINGNYANVTWNPGEGMIIRNFGPATTIILDGTPAVPVLPPTNYCGCGQWSLLSPQTTNGFNTYQDVTGFAPQNGAQVSFGFPTNGIFSTNATYANGAWSPTDPILTNGQAAFYFVPCVTNCITLSCGADKTYPCGTTNWSFDPPTNIVDTCCSNFTVTFMPVGNSGPCPLVLTGTWVVTDACGNSNSCSQKLTIPCCTNCCDDCTAPFPASYTVTVYPGANFLADNLCQGTNSTLIDQMTSVPNQSQILLWNGTSYVVAATKRLGSWSANFPFKAGEGFVLQVPGGAAPFSLTISGCPPDCPPPCLTPTNGTSVLVGGVGLGTGTWTNLSSCGPPCGAQMQIWNGSGFTEYNYYQDAWHDVNGNTVAEPALPAGQSAYVSVKPNIHCCSPLYPPVIQCSNLAVVSCTNVQVFYPTTVSDPLCTNVTLTFSPTNGSWFGPGTTNLVHVVAEDCCSNTATCDFTVTIVCATNPCLLAVQFPAEIELCMGTNGCAPMPDATLLVEINTSPGSRAGVSQSIPSGTLLCSSTNVTLAVTNDCGDATNAIVPVVLEACCCQPTTNVVVVPGPADPWLAGLPDGTPDGADIAPAESPTEYPGVVTGGDIFTFSSSGTTAYGPATGYFNALGDVGTIFNRTYGDANGISLLTAPISSLVGVFLDDNDPRTEGTPPPGLTWNLETYPLQPGLRQTFYIGDGSGGQIIAPPGATRLFLGIMDTTHSNNLGGLTVTVVASNVCLAVSAAPTNIDICVGYNACGPMPDVTGLVHVSGDSGPVFVSQSIPAGTILCSGTSVILTVTNLCGNTTNLTVPVTLTTYPAVMEVTCASNKTVNCYSNWTFDLPTVLTTCCDTNVTIHSLGTVTNGVCPQYITNYWLISDSWGDTNICSQAVTVEGCCTNSGATNSGCCGPNAGPQTIHWLPCPASSSPSLIPDPSGINTNGTWMVTNLPCYGNVLITQTFSGAPPGGTYWSSSWLGPLFGTAPGPGVFQDVQAGYGPYSWAAFNNLLFFINGLTAQSYEVHIYFLNGQPNPCTLYLGVAGLASSSTATVSQPVVFRAEYDQQASALAGASANTSLDGNYGPAVAGTSGTVLGSAFSLNHVGGPVDTGLAILQPANVLATAVLPPGSGQGINGSGPYPAPGSYPCLSLSVYQQAFDGVGFTVGYVCCSNCLAVQCPTNKTVPCDSNWSFDPPTAYSCSSNVNVLPIGTTTNGNCPQYITQTWLVTDGAGNSDTCTQMVTVTSVPLSFALLPGGTNFGCNPSSNSLPTDASIRARVEVSGGCSSVTTNVTQVDIITNCTTYRTFAITASNACGSVISTNIQYAWTIDTGAPVFAVGVTNIFTNICAGSVTIPIAASATDSCCTNVTLNFYNPYPNLAASGASPATANLTFNVGTNTVTIVATDCCGNHATNTVKVIVFTNPPPTLSLITNRFKICITTNGCGTLGDMRYLVNANYPNNVTQSPPPNTVICPGSNTNITFTCTNPCGTVVVTNATAFLGLCCDPPPTNMVLWLTFDELTGATCYNSAGQNPGTRRAGAAATKPPNSPPARIFGQYVNNCLNFDGNSYVSLRSYASLAFGTGDFSIDAWVKWTNSPSANQVILMKESPGSPYNYPPPTLYYGYGLYLNNGFPTFEMYSGTTTPGSISQMSHAITLNTWTHLAVTVQRSKAPKQVSIYENGKLITTTSITTFTGSINDPVMDFYPPIPPYPPTVTVGVSSRDLNSYFKGYLDEIELFKNVLSPTDVTNLYVAKIQGKCRPTLGLPSVRVCPANSNVTVTATICNNGSDQRTYLVNFSPLGTTTIPGVINWAAPVPTGGYFSLNPQTITVLPGQCANLTVTIKLPSNFNSGSTLAYQMSALDTGIGGDTTFYIGTIVGDQTLCPIIHHGGTNHIALLPGSSTTNLNFTIANTLGVPATFNVRILAVDNNFQPDGDFLSLNGLPPGTPVDFTVPLDVNGTTNVSATVGYVDSSILQPYYVLLLVDDGAGGPLAEQDSVTLINILKPTEGPPLFIDNTNGQPVVSWDAINYGWTLDANPDLSGTNWSPLPQTVGPLPDGSQGVTVQPTNSAEFFRLRQ